MKFLQNLINRTKRNTKRKQSKSKQTLTVSSFRGVKPEKVRKSRIGGALWQWLLIIFLLGLAIYFYVYPLANALWKFNPVDGEQAQEQELEEQEWQSNERLAVLLIGVDDTHKYTNFVDSVTLLVLESDNSLGIFALHPDLSGYSPSLDEKVNIRTIFTTPAAKGQEYLIVKEVVESVLALRIDNHIALGVSGFKEITQHLDPVSVTLAEDLVDPQAKIELKQGDRLLQPDQFLPFISADENGKEQQFFNELNFFSSLITNLASPRSLLFAPKIIESLDEHIKTDLTKKEFFRLTWKLSKYRDDQIKIAYTQDESLYRASSFGVYPKYEAITSSIDEDLASILLNTTLLKEQAKIEVLNGSSVPGLASSRSRWIANSGGRVIQFSNSPERTEITRIYVNQPEKYPNTLNQIEKIFNYKVEYPEQEYRYKHLGDIVVVIGEEYN